MKFDLAEGDGNFTDGAWTDVLAAVGEGRPVAVLIGRVVPRHWVLLVEAGGGTLRCYEPSAGVTRSVSVDALRR